MKTAATRYSRKVIFQVGKRSSSGNRTCITYGLPSGVRQKNLTPLPCSLRRGTASATKRIAKFLSLSLAETISHAASQKNSISSTLRTGRNLLGLAGPEYTSCGRPLTCFPSATRALCLLLKTVQERKQDQAQSRIYDSTRCKMNWFKRRRQSQQLVREEVNKAVVDQYQ